MLTHEEDADIHVSPCLLSALTLTYTCMAALYFNVQGLGVKLVYVLKKFHNRTIIKKSHSQFFFFLFSNCHWQWKNNALILDAATESPAASSASTFHPL